MIEKPLVTIVTPSYKQAHFLEETILSVLNQDYPNIEYIIIDGGSQDGSVDIIRKYENRLAYWVSEPDRGMTDAINKGWERATGEYIGWINSDDLLLPGAVSEAVAFLDKNSNVGFVFGNIFIIDFESRIIDHLSYKDFNIYDLIRTAGYISQQGNLFRRSLYKKIGPLDPALDFQMDLDYWIRAGLVCDVGYIRKDLGSIRRHSATKTSTQVYRDGDDILKIYQKTFSQNHLPERLLKSKSELFSHAYLYAANTYYYSGRQAQAYQLLRKAVFQFPPILFSYSFLKFLSHIFYSFILGGSDLQVYAYIRRIYITHRKKWPPKDHHIS